MEDGGGGFGYGFSPENNIPPSLHHHRSTPPLSAIDRFLWGQTNIINHNTEIPNSSNGFSNISSSPIFENGGGLIWPTHITHAGVFVDGIETQNWDKNLKVDQGQNQGGGKSGGKKKRVNGGYPSNLIKGQWTDEEDRKLVRLVKQFGVRKWAQIAEKMVGRAGKQCRERWHNHLRPDIKKDNWSEEEERLLVEAHQNIGNKWAEIAKQIPGRSENSIKNHWNATKRRQNSRRKSKKSAGKNGKSQPSILQDYIRTKVLEEPKNPTTSALSTSTTPANSTISDDQSTKFNIPFPQSPSEDSTSLITPTYDEELDFMLQFFASNNVKAPLVDDGKLLVNSLGYGFSSSTINNVVPEEVALPDNKMQADNYLSFLLDGGPTLPFIDYGYNDSSMDFEQQMTEDSSSGTKEMDLIEMLSASKFSQGSNQP